MLARDIDDLLTLLAVTVLADGRVMAEEIDTFMREVKDLQSARDIEPRITEAKLLSWFEMRRSDLQSRIAAPDFEAWISPIVKRLGRLDNKSQILAVMHKISLADKDFHVSEDRLMRITAHHWNITYPAPKPATKKTLS